MKTKCSGCKKKPSASLWWHFVFIIFSIMAASSLLMGLLAAFSYRNGLVGKISDSYFPVLFYLVISVLIGTIISAFVARRILYPITQFSAAAKAVAKGDFTVKMEGSNRIKEIDELSSDFNTMVSELASIETLRSDFVVNVSHEFKTPIAAIEGYATLLQDESLTAEERSEYTRMIIESTKQLSALTGNILRISKLENQEFISDKVDFRLDEQIRQAILMLETEWSRKNIELDIELQTAYYNGNKELMLQVWINLLNNAVKFTPDNGKIEVALIQANSFVQVMVSDSGIGMDEATIKHIFEKFYQGDKTRSLKGNGLGLPLVKRIVELCQGEINVDSKIGSGTTFMVRLPVGVPTPPAPTGKEKKQSSSKNASNATKAQ